MEFVISSVTCDFAVICRWASHCSTKTTSPPRRRRSGKRLSQVRAIVNLRTGLFVLFPVKARAARRGAGCHHELANLFALGPAARLCYIIVRAIHHFHTPQRAFVGL